MAYSRLWGVSPLLDWFELPWIDLNDVDEVGVAAKFPLDLFVFLRIRDFIPFFFLFNFFISYFVMNSSCL